MTRAEELSENGYDLDLCACFVETATAGGDCLEATRRWGERYPDSEILAVMKTMREIAAKDRELSIRDARADGKLWDIMCVLKPGKTLILVTNGRHDDSMERTVFEQHPDAVGIMRTEALGDRRAARLAAVDAINVEQIEIRFI